MYFANNDLQSITSIASYRLDFCPEHPRAKLLFLNSRGFGILGHPSMEKAKLSMGERGER
jgi:hypothetical protein